MSNCRKHPRCNSTDSHEGLCSESSADGSTQVFMPESIDGSGSARYPNPGTTDWTDRGKADYES